ncbi:MAG TPA: hypothetical protein VFV58_24885 [Blastocatellia bacterium]|jgi:hypothetical protein|nr:hypothetical protein [Blastocatellia bacterium]
MRRNCRKCFSLIVLLITFSALNSRPSAQKNSLGYSGVFDGLTVGVDSRNKTISGYFFDQTGWDETTRSPTFTCAFYLQGHFQDDKYVITTWYPGETESIKGQLKFVTVDGQTNVEIKLEREHGGCGNVHHFTAEDGGGNLTETKRGDWFAVRVVSAKRAYFYSRPSLKARKKQYLVSYNPIRIFQVKNNWVEAEFEAEKTTRGWIKMSDLFPAEVKKSSK